MKAKLLITAIGLLLLVLIFSSCSIRTCPTYAKGKHVRSDSIIKSINLINSLSRLPATVEFEEKAVLDTTALRKKSPLPESNQRPTDYKSVALPAELRRRNEAAKLNEVAGIANV